MPVFVEVKRSSDTRSRREVAANLDAGRVRLLFVADELSSELRRIIEFLNEQMRTAEVLGVELRRFVADGHAAYVPAVVGRTETAVDAKGVPAGRSWDETSFLETAETRCSAAEVSMVRRLFRHIHENAGVLKWGGSPQNPGAGGWYPAGGEPRPVWRLHAKNTGAQFRSTSPACRPRSGPAGRRR